MKAALIIGMGRFGTNCARKLNAMGHEVMAVDVNETKINRVLPYVTNAQIGDSTNGIFLDSLGVNNYDVCIVTIADSFQNSLETVSLLKDRGAKKVIARAASSIHEKFLLRNGADSVIYPEKQLAEWTAIRCSSSTIKDYFNIEGPDAIFEMEVPVDWVGKTLIQLDLRRKYEINVIAVRKRGELNINVSPEVAFQATDTVMILGNEDTIRKKFKL